MFKQIPTFWLMCLLLNITDAIKEQCSEGGDLLQRCSMPFPVLSSPDISFALNRTELQKNCIELRAGIRCINNYTNICMDSNEKALFMQVYSGITDVVNDLCSPGQYQSDYLKHADCVNKVRPEYEVCSEKYSATLQRLNKNPTTNPANGDFLSTFCCSIKEYIACSEGLVQRSCGDEAALFTIRFMKRMSSAFTMKFCSEYQDQECALLGKGSHESYSKILTLVALAAYLVNNYT